MAENSQSAAHLTATDTDRTPPVESDDDDAERRCRAAKLSLEKDRSPIVMRAQFGAVLRET